MGLKLSEKGDLTLIRIGSQLIVGNREQLKEKVLKQLERGSRKFIVDFSKTDYIDSSGLGVLVTLSKKIREEGGELSLAELSEDLRILFELTRIDSLFLIL